MMMVQILFDFRSEDEVPWAKYIRNIIDSMSLSTVCPGILSCDFGLKSHSKDKGSPGSNPRTQGQ